MAESSGSVSSVSEEIESLTDPQRPQNHFNFVSKVRRTGLYTDVTIIVGTERFPAHRIVLASLSDYFPPLFKIDENDSREVTLHNIKAEEFVVFLDYAYTGKVDLTKDNVQDILITSDYLNVGFVKECCIKFMADNFDTDNICDILLFSLHYPIPELAEKAKEFWIHHLEEVSQTEGFFRMDAALLEKIFADDKLILYGGSAGNSILASKEREELLLNSVLRYLSKVSTSNPEIIEIMIRTVRLPQISKDSIMKCLKNFKILKDNKVIKKYIDLREKFVKGAKKNAHLKGQEVPETWLRERILAIISIYHGGIRYASDGQIRRAPNPPSYLYDDRNIQIKRIAIWSRIWDNAEVIGGLTLTYRSSSKHVDCSSTYEKGHCPEGRANHVVELEPDEFIVKVVVGSGWLIDRLGFKTNKGRMLGPYGGPGGSESEESAPPGGLSYLHDINCDTVMTQGAGAIYNLMLRWITFS